MPALLTLIPKSMEKWIRYVVIVYTLPYKLIITWCGCYLVVTVYIATIVSSKLCFSNIFQDVDSDFDPMEERSSHQIVPASKAKVKSVKKIPENSTLPHITVDQYSTRSAMLSSLVVAWSPILQSHAKISSSPQHDSSLSLLAVGGKSGQVSVWRVSVPECYSVDQSRDPTKLMLIQIIQAHKPWITAISWALLDSDSSNPQLLLATASYNGRSVRSPAMIMKTLFLAYI